MRLPSPIKHTSLFNRSILCQTAFWAWVALSLGIVIGDYTFSFYTPPRLYHGFVTGAIVFTVGAAITLFRRAGWRSMLFLTAGLMVITVSRQKSLEFDQNSMRGRDRIEKVGIVGKTIGESVPLLNIYRTTISATRLSDRHGLRPLNGKKIRCYSPHPIPLRSLVTVHGRLRKPSIRYYNDSFSPRRHYQSTGTWGSIDADSVSIDGRDSTLLLRTARSFRSYVYALLAETPDPAHAAILKASFLGEKHFLAEDLKELFRNAGIFHLLAISGLHMGILIASTCLFMAFIPVDRRWKTGITLIVIWAYVMFIGALPSLIRAAVMASVILLTLLFQRKQYSLNTLGIAGCVWLLCSPQSLFTPGYQLSFAATAAIIASQPVIRRVTVLFPPGPLKKAATWLIGSFMVSTAGFLGTAPILHYHFGTLSVVGLITNVGAVVIMSVSMYLFFVALCLFRLFPPLASGFMMGASEMLSLVVGLAEKTTTLRESSLLPMIPWSVWILYAIGVIGLVVIHPKRIIQYAAWTIPLLLLTAASILLVHQNPTDTEIVLFNTGPTTMAGIRFPNGPRWLIGTTDAKRWDYNYRSRIQSWQRERYAGKLESFILPRKEPNITHVLHPLIRNGAPRNLLSAASVQNAPFADRDLKELLETNHINDIRISSSAILYPTPECSVFVEAGEAPEAGELYTHLRTGNLRISFLPHMSTTEGGQQSPELTSIDVCLNSPIVSFESFAPGLKLDLTKGAGRIRIRENDSVIIYQYTGRRWKIIDKGSVDRGLGDSGTRGLQCGCVKVDIVTHRDKGTPSRPPRLCRN